MASNSEHSYMIDVKSDLNFCQIFASKMNTIGLFFTEIASFLVKLTFFFFLFLNFCYHSARAIHRASRVQPVCSASIGRTVGRILATHCPNAMHEWCVTLIFTFNSNQNARSPVFDSIAYARACEPLPLPLCHTLCRLCPFEWDIRLISARVCRSAQPQPNGCVCCSELLLLLLWQDKIDPFTFGARQQSQQQQHHQQQA